MKYVVARVEQLLKLFRYYICVRTFACAFFKHSIIENGHLFNKRLYVCVEGADKRGWVERACVLQGSTKRARYLGGRILIRAFANVKMSTGKITSWRGGLMRSSNIEIVPNCHYRDKWPERGFRSPVLRTKAVRFCGETG